MKPAAPQYLPLFPYLEAHRAACLLAPGELVIDNFAGIGGASTGMEAALGRPVDHAINHDPVAVSLHRVNHPHSHHSVEDVWQVDPLDITGGQRVALAWFSPTCTHFSKAKGAPLVDRKIRGLAWVAVKWAHLVRPRVIILENVEEFQDWGPLKPAGDGSGLGYPDPAQKGRTFNSFVNALRKYGYDVEWRELRACDYGTPTIRKRLFLVARCDGLPIIWPAPTHAAPTDPRVKAGQLKPYRTAAECIDWDLPCPSIFDRKKPLVRNTLNRVAQGLRRFVLEAGQPFIVTCNHGGEGFRGQDVQEPFRTITAAHEAHGLVEPQMAPVIVNKQHGNPARSATQPLSTVTTNTSKNELVSGALVACGGRGAQARPKALNETMHTVTSKADMCFATAHLVRHMGGGLAPEHASYPASEPARTVLASGGPQALVSGALIKADNQRSRTSCTQALNTQLGTIVTKNNQALVTAHLGAYYSSNGAGDLGQEADQPLRTIPTVDRFNVTAATLMRQFGNSTAADIAAPCPTVMTEGMGKTGVITADLTPGLTDAQLDRARQVAAFLTEYLTPEQLVPYLQGGLVVLGIRGELYVLVDIGMRMLTPRELARCQGFPDTYELEKTAEGKPISKARQVRGIGNSVCPQLAQVLTHAQLTAVAEEAAD